MIFVGFIRGVNGMIFFVGVFVQFSFFRFKILTFKDVNGRNY